jgi:hypothetical protein
VGTAKRIILHGVVIAIIAVALVWWDTYSRQQEQFLKGETARGRGNPIVAMAAYEASIHMYTPGSSTVEKAAGRLWAMGEDFEKRNDRERALIAFRSLRSSFYAARGFTLPGKSWIDRCDKKIAKLVSKDNDVH